MNSSTGQLNFDDGQCAICLGPHSKIKSQIRCGHVFCFECLLTNCQFNLECPLCRQSFENFNNIDIESLNADAIVYTPNPPIPASFPLSQQTLILQGNLPTARSLLRPGLNLEQRILISYLQRQEQLIQDDIYRLSLIRVLAAQVPFTDNLNFIREACEKLLRIVHPHEAAAVQHEILNFLVGMMSTRIDRVSASLENIRIEIEQLE